MTTKPLFTRSTIGVLLAGAAIWPTLATAADGTSAEKARHASCILTITPGSSATPINAETVSDIVQSVGVAGRAVSDVLGIPLPMDGELLDISFDAIESDPGEDIRDLLGAPITGKLYVEYYEGADAYRAGADQLLAAITSRLSKVLEEQGAAHRAILTRQHDVATEDVNQTKTRLGQLQEATNAMRSEAGRTDLSREAIVDEIRELESALRESALDLASHRARREAIAAQIATLGERVRRPPGADEVTHALEQVVELREMNAEKTRALFEKGTVSESELKQVQVEHAMAQAELARHLEESAEAAGGGAMAELNQQLTHLSIEAVDVEARQKSLSERLEQVRSTKLLELADRYEREIRVQREVAEDMLEEALRRQAATERLIRAFQSPTVVVVGGQ